MPAGLEAASRYANLALRAFGEENDLVPPGVAIESGDVPDWLYQKRHHVWTCRNSNVATVGVNNGFGISNTSTNQIVVVTMAQLLSGGQTVYVQDIVSALPANYILIGSTSIYRHDSRYNANFVSGLTMPSKTAGGQSAGFTTLNWSIADPSGTQDSRTPPGWFAVLMPGRHITFEQSAANVILTMQCMGYIREAEPQELVS